MGVSSSKVRTLLVTGGAGFIGSNFVHFARSHGHRVVNLDLLTYAGNPLNLKALDGDEDYVFVRGDIRDRALVRDVLKEREPDAIVNFAAESHVDRSIESPDNFIQTNVIGTFHLIEETKGYWKSLPLEKQNRFRFLHVSTDEVFGSLNAGDPAFHESTAYSPNSPYAASKAASDHLVRAYHHTYGLPTLITNCSNNYGPRQFPEKLIPLMILNGMEGKALPVYGNGQNVRDWLYVDDHCEALDLVLRAGRVGETYNIGGRCEKANMEVVRDICGVLDDIYPESPHRPHSSLISFVVDRPGHDLRYAIDCSKIERDLGWRAKETFSSGLEKTIRWYIDNRDWVDSVRTGVYRDWMERQYGNAGN